MKIRKFESGDLFETINMLKDFIKELYPNRKIGNDIAFTDTVLNWIKQEKHIFVTTTNENKITGFSLSYVEYNNHLTEPVYHGEVAYVKHLYRGGKSAYLLYNNGVRIAKDLGLILTSNAFVNQHKIDKIQSKLGLKQLYISMELNKEV